MGLSKSDQTIPAEAKTVFNNPNLRNKDIREWTTSEQVAKENCEDGEVVAKLPDLGFWVCVYSVNDKR